MATLKKSKFDILLNYARSGDEINNDKVADLLGLDPEDVETIDAYIRKLSLYTSQDVVETTTTTSTYQLRDEFGVLRDLEILKEKNGRVILSLPVVRDLVDIVIKGKKVTVDLEQLRKLPPNDLQDGVRVSTLIDAAEIARL
jgi:hypothetical protein